MPGVSIRCRPWPATSCQRWVARARGAVQDAGGEGYAAEQGVAERGLADADAAEDRNMQFAGRQFVQQRLDLGKILAQFTTHGVGYTFIIEQCAQGVAGARDVRVAGSR